MSEQTVTSQIAPRKIAALAVMMIAIWCTPAAVLLWAIPGLNAYIAVALFIVSAGAVWPLMVLADRLWWGRG